MKYILALLLVITSTGCIFGGKKTTTAPPTQIVRPGVNPKLILKISGPAGWESGAQAVQTELLKLPYVDDACVSNKYYVISV